MILRALARSPWIRVLRLEYQGDNFLTWFSATAVALRCGARLDPASFVLGLVTLVLAQAGLELLDGYHDFEQGAHGRKSPGDQVWTGGSGVLAEGALRPRVVRRAAWICGLSAGALFAVLTVARTGLAGLVIGLAGAFCGAGWAMPPFKLSYRGLGEAAQAVVAGPLMAAMAWVIAAGSFDVRALAVGAPFGLLELAMALSHNMVDADADSRAGKRTLVVRIGRRAAARGAALSIALAFAAVGALIVAGVLPLSAAVCGAAAPVALGAVRLVRRAAADPAALDELGRAFPPYRLLVTFGLLLLSSLLASVTTARVPHAGLVLASFAVCFAPVLLVLAGRRAA